MVGFDLVSYCNCLIDDWDESYGETSQSNADYNYYFPKQIASDCVLPHSVCFIIYTADLPSRIRIYDVSPGG